MKLYIELEKGDEVLEESHGGTFIVRKHGHCFKSIDYRLKDYKPGDKIRVDYIGNLDFFHTEEEIFPKLPWIRYGFNKIN